MTIDQHINAAYQRGNATGLGLEFVAEKNFTQSEGLNSPPLEGCPKGGVVISPSLEGCPKGGVVNSPNPQDIITYINHIPIKRNFVENLPHNPALNQLARDKRKAGILSEVLFWQQVHQGKFHKIDFDRQRIIGNYIVDFYVKTLGLIVEIDGDSHYDKIEYDARRQQYFESLGLRMYRIADGDVKNNLDNVMLGLEKYVVSEYGENNSTM
jgi:very-short-patch-repair endonuclease